MLQGMESEKEIELMLSFTAIQSESIIKALKEHYVKGASINEACVVWEVTSSNFNRSANKLKRVESKIDEIIGLRGLVRPNQKSDK